MIYEYKSHYLVSDLWASDRVKFTVKDTFYLITVRHVDMLNVYTPVRMRQHNFLPIKTHCVILVQVIGKCFPILPDNRRQSVHKICVKFRMVNWCYSVIQANRFSNNRPRFRKSSAPEKKKKKKSREI